MKSAYLRQARDLQGNYMATKQLMQRRLLEWKRNLLTTAYEQCRLILKHSSSASDGFTQVEVEELKRDQIHIDVKNFMWKIGN